MTDETPEPENGSLVAAGGWCAPSTTLYDTASLETNDYTMVSSLFPVLRVLRPGTPAWDAHQIKMAAERDAEASVQALVHRLIRNVTALQDEALSRVYLDADDAGLDVLLESPPTHHSMWRWDSPSAPAYRFIGLALVERSPETWRRLQGDRPIIIRATASGPYDDDWYDD